MAYQARNDPDDHRESFAEMSICFEKADRGFPASFATRGFLGFATLFGLFGVLIGAIVAARYPGESSPALGTLAVHSGPEMSRLVGVDFEVFGRVQGVFFRKYTKKRAEELSLKGWCMNTERDTVVGRVEGEKAKIEDMKHWLRKTGSPQSAIDKAEFRDEKDIAEVTFTDFSIKK